jgi:O-antigen/teichoic acid export membrane protein
MQTFAILVPVAIVLAVGARYVLRLFGTEYVAGGASLLRLFAAAAVPNVVVVVGLAIARIQHDGRTVLMIQGATCVGTLGLAFLLLPRMGINGIGVAWLVTQAAVAAWLLASTLRRVLLTAGS